MKIFSRILSWFGFNKYWYVSCHIFNSSNSWQVNFCTIKVDSFEIPIFEATEQFARYAGVPFNAVTILSLIPITKVEYERFLNRSVKTIESNSDVELQPKAED